MLPIQLSALQEILKSQLIEPLAIENIASDVELRRIITDSRQISQSDLFVAIKGDQYDGHDFIATAFDRGASAALVSSEWAKRHRSEPWAKRCLSCRDVLEAFRYLASWLRKSLPYPVFGIGGSNGKTTTKELLAAALYGHEKRIVCKTFKSENGYLGLAQTVAKASLQENRLAKALVLEIGIDESGAMEQHVALFKPDIVLLTALAAEHVAGFGSSENAIAEEFLLFSLGQPQSRIWNMSAPALLDPKRLRYLDPKTDVLVVSERNLKMVANTIQQHAQFLENNSLRFLIWRASDSLADGTTVLHAWEWNGVTTDLATAVSGPGKSFHFALIGAHNANNGALAIAAARAYGESADSIAYGLMHHFEAPAQRNVYRELKDGRLLIDDTYNASPASMQSALENLRRQEWLNRPIYLFLADMAELGNESKTWHEKLAEQICQVNPEYLLLYGDEIAATHASLKHFGVTSELIKKENDPLTILPKIKIPPDAIVLVKGSRSMKMERIVHWLQENLG